MWKLVQSANQPLPNRNIGSADCSASLISHLQILSGVLCAQTSDGKSMQVIQRKMYCIFLNTEALTLYCHFHTTRRQEVVRGIVIVSLTWGWGQPLQECAIKSWFSMVSMLPGPTYWVLLRVGRWDPPPPQWCQIPMQTSNMSNIEISAAQRIRTDVSAIFGLVFLCFMTLWCQCSWNESNRDMNKMTSHTSHMHTPLGKFKTFLAMKQPPCHHQTTAVLSGITTYGLL